MITRAEAGKLGAVHVVEPAVLSLYLTVPLDPAGLRSLPARAGELIAAAEGTAGDRGRLREQDRNAAVQKLAVSGRDWLGRTAAIFACAGAGLFEAFPLPCQLPERAVPGTRPHIRPLLVALQRCPAYRVAVVDSRHAWLFWINGDKIETVSAPDAASVRDSRFGGWYGLETYHVQQRVAGLARHHYRQTAALLEQATRHGGREPLVIAGHADGVRQLLASLPPALRESFAGSFAADTHTLTPGRVRDLAAPLVARWAEQRAQRLADEILALPPGHLVAVGLRACLAAVSAGAVQTLIVPDDGLVPGYECGRCGALSTDADGCPDWGAAALPVPDVIEEMAARTVEDGIQVSVIHDARSRIAARLHVPVTP